MKKAIFLQTINDSGLVSQIKQTPWCSVTFDNVKIVVDAYLDGIEPREDCKIEIVDSKDCYQLNSEQLLDAIRFYIAYSASPDAIIHFPNKFQYVIPDAVKVAKKGFKMPQI
jgi:hypothetical protein